MSKNTTELAAELRGTTGTAWATFVRAGKMVGEAISFAAIISTWIAVCAVG